MCPLSDKLHLGTKGLRLYQLKSNRNIMLHELASGFVLFCFPSRPLLWHVFAIVTHRSPCEQSSQGATRLEK